MKTLKQLLLIAIAMCSFFTGKAQTNYTGGMGYFMVGMGFANNSKTQDKLKSTDLLGSSFSFNPVGTIFGGKGFGIYNRFLIGGGGYAVNIGGESNSGSAKYTMAGGGFNVGYAITQNDNNIFYAFAGFGGGGGTLHITNNSIDTMRFAANQQILSGENKTISGGGSSFEFGVGLNQFVIKHQNTSGGFMVGLIAGINYIPGRSWEFESNKTAVAGLGGRTSFYFGITIGGGGFRTK